MTPSEIEMATNSELRNGPFPYDDCRWLLQHKGANDDLIPDLDMYFSTITGFGTSVSRLQQRRPEMLRKQLHDCRSYLGLGFFERHAQHRHLEPDISDINTPKLSKQIAAANQIRIALLPILDELLLAEENRKATA